MSGFNPTSRVNPLPAVLGSGMAKRFSMTPADLEQQREERRKAFQLRKVQAHARLELLRKQAEENPALLEDLKFAKELADYEWFDDFDAHVAEERREIS